MRTKIIEGTSPQGLYLKAMVARFGDDDWARPSIIGKEYGLSRNLLAQEGWGKNHFIIFDLSQIGAGAMFCMGGIAKWDFDHAPVVF